MNFIERWVFTGPRGPDGTQGAQGEKGDNGDTVIFDLNAPLVILATGQSNFFRNLDYAWTPPDNLTEWNYVGQTYTIGTAFAAIDPTKINAPASFAAEIAKANPLRQIRLIRVAWGSQAIAAWVGGFDYSWSTNTTASDPTDGFIKGNNATPASITQLYISEQDVHVIDRVGQILGIGSGTEIRIESVNDSSIFILFVASAQPTDNGEWHTIPGAVTSANGVLTGSATVKVRVSPDMYQLVKDNVEAALTVLNLTKIDQFLWWQGESDSPFQVQNTPGYFLEQYAINFETLVARLQAEAWFDARTPMVLWGIVSEATGGLTNHRIFNARLQRVVHADPENRLFVYHNLEGDDFWIPIPGFPELSIHMTALGYDRYGRSSARALLDRLGRNTPAGVAIDPENANVYIEDGSLVIGELSPLPEKVSIRSKGGIDAVRVVIEGEAESQLRVSRFSSDTAAPFLEMRKQRGTIAAPLVVNVNDVLGQLLWLGWDGAQPRIAAEVRGTMQAATPSSTDMEARVGVFACGPGAIVETEIARWAVATGLSMFGANVVIDANRIYRCRLYTVTTLPTVTPAGQFIYVTNMAGGPEPAFSDATNWRRFSDRSVVS